MDQPHLRPRYFNYNEKIYKIVMTNGAPELTVLNEKTGAFEHQLDMRAFDVETRGIEVPAEEVLRKLR